MIIPKAPDGVLPDHDAKRYQRGKRMAVYAGLIIDVCTIMIWQFGGFSVRLRDVAVQLTDIRLLSITVYFVVFVLVMLLIQLPLTFFRGYWWEHRFGLSHQRWMSWLADEGKKFVLSVVIGLAMVQAVYHLLYLYPRYWWVGAGIFWLAISVLLTRLLPQVIIPLFYRYEEVGDEDLRRQVQELFERCAVPLEGVYALKVSVKSKKVNAFVCGLGKNRRVVLTDTLLAQFSAPEILAVIAHELGHYKHRDIIKLLAANTLMVLVAFFTAHLGLGYLLDIGGRLHIADIAGLPLLLLTLGSVSFVLSPLSNAFSRWMERQADRFSLETMGNPDVFISMMQKLGALNLAEMQPGRFHEIMFYDHPPIGKRIALARQWQKGRSL